MLKDLHTLTPYLDFIRTCNADPDYRDPMLLTQQQLHRNLLDVPENPNTRVFGTFEGEAITGVFALLVLEDERYLELLAGLSRSAAAYAELLSHLKSAHPGYQADFVYNPRNRLLQEALAALGAEFEPEQQKLVLCRAVPYVPDARIVPYRPEYRAQYLALVFLKKIFRYENQVRRIFVVTIFKIGYPEYFRMVQPHLEKNIVKLLSGKCRNLNFIR